ncbi:MAG: single-stranded DNA-binding protein [Acidobacteria bacterium]|nr:single-stranded DNA-binding protein [Acidobacteriota bacterium]
MSAFGIISGRLGIEPELRYTNSGKPVVNLSIANNRSVKVGETRETIADWHKITVFGRDAEIIAQYAKKGSALAFNGRLQNEKWVDRDGIHRTSTVLIASSFEFLPGKKREESGESNAGAGTTVNGAGPSQSGDEGDDNIPF